MSVHPDYLPALKSICLSPKILATSPLQARLSYLGRSPAPPVTPLLVSLVRTAFKLPSDAHVYRLVTTLPLFDLHSPTHLFRACSDFVAGLRWEGPYLRAALALLLQSETPDGLGVCVGVMAQASTSCASRRRAALCSVLMRVPEPKEGWGDEEMGVVSTRRSSLFSGASPSPAAVEAAFSRIHEMLTSHVHDLKDAAFESTFVQPSAAGAALSSPPLHYAVLDGEVHGAPTLAAVLLATTGVRTSRAPELLDEATGFCDGAAALCPTALAALWAHSALGRPWDGLRGVKDLPLAAAVPADTFCGWRASRLDSSVPTVLAYATRCADGGRRFAENRARFAKVYLAQFASYLSENFVLPRLTALVLTQPSHVALLLPAVRLHLREEAVTDSESVSEEPGEYLYNMDDFPPTLRTHRARALFQLLGILRDECEEAPDNDSSVQQQQQDEEGEEGAKELPLTPSSCVLTVSGCIRGGGTRREFASNLLQQGEEPWNKWVDPMGAFRPSWIELHFFAAVTVTGYALCSANDCPARDPTSWTVYGTKDATAPAREWKVLHKVEGGGEGGGFEARWQWIQSFFNSPAQGLRGLRLEIHSLRGGRGVDCMQLGHIKVFGWKEETDEEEEGAREEEKIWTCTVCTLENSVCNQVCEACEEPRSENEDLDCGCPE